MAALVGDAYLALSLDTAIHLPLGNATQDTASHTHVLSTQHHGPLLLSVSALDSANTDGRTVHNCDLWRSSR